MARANPCASRGSAAEQTQSTSGAQLHDPGWLAGLSDYSDYSLAISIATVRGVNPPEICDAIKNAATTAGTLINLRNWSTESIVFAPKNAVAQKPVQFAAAAAR